MPLATTPGLPDDIRRHGAGVATRGKSAASEGKTQDSSAASGSPSSGGRQPLQKLSSPKAVRSATPDPAAQETIFDTEALETRAALDGLRTGALGPTIDSTPDTPPGRIGV